MANYIFKGDFKVMSRLLIRISVLICGSLLISNTFAVGAKLRILETTDIHMNLLDYDYYQDKSTIEFGLARTITLIKEAQQEQPNNLLIDNGDLLQGSPMGDYVAKTLPNTNHIHPAYTVMNELKYDVGNIGNHEFNFGLPFLNQAIKGAKFPYISANVLDAKTGKPYFKPYVILDKKIKLDNGELANIKVGVIGFVPPQIMQWDKKHLEGKVRALDIVEAAKKYIPEMKKAGADLIIAVPHSGLGSGSGEKMAENAVHDLARIKGIDALLFGHSHEEFPSAKFKDWKNVDLANGKIDNIAAVMPGKWGDNLGLVDFDLEYTGNKWKVLASKGFVRPILDRKTNQPLVEADPVVMQLIESWHTQTLKEVRKEIAKTSSAIYSYFSVVEASSPEALIHNAQLWIAKQLVANGKYSKLPLLSAAAPFKAGGRQGFSYYTDVESGALAVKNIADLYIFPNTINIVRISGNDVRQWLEMSAGQFNTVKANAKQQEFINNDFPTFNFDSLAGDGLSYVIDITKAPRYNKEGVIINKNSSRISNLTYRGKPLNDNMEFLVVTNNYRAYGGGNFPKINAQAVVVSSAVENREALTQYLAHSKMINPISLNNWKINAGNAKLVFTTGAGAAKYLSKHPEFRLIKTNDNNSIDLEFDPAKLSSK